MLRESTIGSATLFVERLFSSQKMIEPVQGSPLHALAYSCITPLRLDKNSGSNIDVEICCKKAVDLSNTFNKLIQTSSDHDVEMDKAVQLASNVIQSNINITRNVIQPMVRDTLEYVETSLAKYSEITFQTPIVTDRVFDVFLHPFIEDMLKEYGDVPYKEFPFINTFPSLTTEAIRDLIPSMNSDMDSRLKEVIDNLGAEKIIGIYEDAFVSGIYDARVIDRNSHLIIMLITNGLLTVGNVALNKEIEKNRTRLEELRNQCALRISNSIQQWKLAYENNRLIISYPEKITSGQAASKLPIIVHEDLYNEWLAAGGDADLIYGAFFSDRTLHGDKLLADRSKYKREAEKYLQELYSANESRRSNVIRSSIRESLNGILEEDSRSEEPRFNKTHLDEVNRRLNEATHLDLNDPLGFTTLIICEALFPETYAKKIIDGLNYYQHQYPNTQVEDLVTIVISDLLVEWVVNLMYIKPIGA